MNEEGEERYDVTEEFRELLRDRLLDELLDELRIHFDTGDNDPVWIVYEKPSFRRLKPEKREKVLEILRRARFQGLTIWNNRDGHRVVKSLKPLPIWLIDELKSLNEESYQVYKTTSVLRGNIAVTFHCVRIKMNRKESVR
jgi:hypothetical protein